MVYQLASVKQMTRVRQQSTPSPVDSEPGGSHDKAGCLELAGSYGARTGSRARGGGSGEQVQATWGALRLGEWDG